MTLSHARFLKTEARESPEMSKQLSWLCGSVEGASDQTSSGLLRFAPVTGRGETVATTRNEGRPLMVVNWNFFLFWREILRWW
jgi:hypothetical protein